VTDAWKHEDHKRLARNAFDSAKQEAVKAEARMGLAEEITKAPPPGKEETRLTLEQEEKLRGLNQRTDSFNDAYTHIEDLPGEQIGEDRWRRVMGVLAEAGEFANEEANRYKEELGLK
jgi:hypothetical protein